MHLNLDTYNNNITLFQEENIFGTNASLRLIITEVSR